MSREESIKIINDVHWFEVKPYRSGPEWYDPDLYINEFTLDELKKAVKEEWDSMSEDEKSFRSIHGDPTYLSWVLGYVSDRMKDDYKVEVDEDNYRCRIVEYKSGKS